MSQQLGTVEILLKAVDEMSATLNKTQDALSSLKTTADETGQTTKGLSGYLTQAGVNVMSFGQAISGLGGPFDTLGSVVTGFGKGGFVGAAVAGLGELVQGLKWSVGEAQASEQAFKNLAIAVELGGMAWGDVEGKTRDYLSELQRTTVYSDEALAGMIERLLTFGMTYEQAMAAAGTALDLAAAKHMDLQGASDLLGKAFMGNTAILKRYGIDVEDIGGKSATFTDIMGKLNDQFGGAAQEQAKTYAGIQERLKNATGELGEKIGGMVLPALASMTEAMIPVVDWFGKGLDSIQAWLTEVGKMPEVKGAMDALGSAFEGFKGYLESVWKVIVDAFGPALQELWQAFKDIWDALQPAIDAFKEIFGALSSGGEDVDIFKLLIQYLAAEIRVIADVIKFVAPYIKAFAEGFKAAADFISPILAQMSKDIGGFIDWLKAAFQGFYDWLVGGSLWMDMWNALVSVASTMIGALLGDLGSNFFEPMKDVFTGAMETVENIWNTSWQAVQTTFDTITSAVQTALNRRFDEMKIFVTTNLGEYAPIANDALSGMQTTMNAVMALIHGDWRGFLNQMDQAMNLFWNAIQGATTLAFTALQTAFTASMNAIKGILDFAIGAMQGAWTVFTVFISQGIDAFKGAISGAQSWLQSTFSSMQATAASAMASIQSTVMTAVSAIVAAARSLWNLLVGGSIWTDMLEEMQVQTASALGNIVGNFQGAFDNVALSVSTIPSQAGPSRGSESSAPLISQPPQNITVPVQVQIDGATVARMVTTRLIQDISARRTIR